MANNIVKVSCGICSSSEFSDDLVGSIDCSHQFCGSCITTWSQRSKKCPLDKKKFTKIEFKDKLSGETKFITEIDKDEYQHDSHLSSDDSLDGDSNNFDDDIEILKEEEPTVQIPITVFVNDSDSENYYSFSSESGSIITSNYESDNSFADGYFDNLDQDAPAEDLVNTMQWYLDE